MFCRLNKTSLSSVCFETVWVCQVMHAGSLADHFRHGFWDWKTARSIGYRSRSRHQQITMCCWTEITATSAGSKQSAHFMPDKMVQFHVRTCKRWCIPFILFADKLSSCSVAVMWWNFCFAWQVEHLHLRLTVDWLNSEFSSPAILATMNSFNVMY